MRARRRGLNGTRFLTDTMMNITRRPFIKTTLAASLGTLAARAEDSPQSGKKLGWALFGLGSLSTMQTAPALLKSNHSQLSGVVTGTPEKGVMWREKYGLAEDKVYSYETFDKIIDDPSIDVVYIVLPNSAKECREMIAGCETAVRDRTPMPV